MSHDAEWEEDWRRLRVQRDEVRQRWLCAVDALSTRAADPLGVKEVVRRHPWLSTGVGAGIGFLAVSLFMGIKKKKRKTPQPVVDETADDDEQPSVIGSAVRHAVTSVATPLLANFVQDRLSQFFNGHEEPATNGRATET
jgi:hypothetical protein